MSDILDRGRELAESMEDPLSNAQLSDAHTVRLLCQEMIASLRGSLAALGPPVPMRLAMYRAALIVAHPIDNMRDIEIDAHKMLRAEREPAR